MATPTNQRFIDEFTDTNGTALDTHDSDWVKTANSGTAVMEIQGNEAAMDSAGSGLATYQYSALAGALNADQAISVEATSFGGTVVGYIGLRNGAFPAGLDIPTCYYVYIWSAYLRLRKVQLNGNQPILEHLAITINPGDVIKLEAVGDDLTVYVNDVSKIAQTDTEWPTGDGKVWIRGGSSSLVTLDDYRIFDDSAGGGGRRDALVSGHGRGVGRGMRKDANCGLIDEPTYQNIIDVKSGRY